MRRREFVRAMVSAAAAPKVLLGQQQNTAAPTPPAPVPWTAGLNPSTPVPKAEIAEDIAEGAARFFTPAQMATLTRLSDLLLPPIGSKPGAVAAGVRGFWISLLGALLPTGSRCITVAWTGWTARRRRSTRRRLRNWSD